MKLGYGMPNVTKIGKKLRVHSVKLYASEMECCLRKLYVVQKDLKVVLNRIDGHSKIEHIAYEIGG